MLKQRKLISIVSALSFLLIATTAPAFGTHAKSKLSAPKSISVAFPNDTATDNVGVTWSQVANNSGYTVRIYKSPNLTKPFITAQIPLNTLSTTFSLAYNSEYRVSVQTKGTGSFSTSPESGKSSFNTNLNAVITTQPAGAVNGVALTTQPVVKIVYPSGSTVTSFTGNVVATIATGTAGTLSGTTMVAAVAGIATFTDLLITGTVGNFTLRFTPVGASAVTSASFALTAGAATQYLVTSSSYSPVAGADVTITAQLADANGNAVSTVGNVVTWTESDGNGSFATATSTTDGSGVATIVFTTHNVATTATTVTATDVGTLTGVSATITTV